MNKKTETSISRNKREIQKRINTDLLQLWKISYHQCRCIRTCHESTFTVIRQSKMKAINCLLCMKTNVYKITIWYSWSKNASYCQSIRTMKNLFIKSKISNNYQVRLQEFTVFYDNKKIEWMISTISRNSSRIWFHHSILQRKKQQLNRHSK